MSSRLRKSLACFPFDRQLHSTDHSFALLENPTTDGQQHDEEQTAEQPADASDDDNENDDDDGQTSHRASSDVVYDPAFLLPLIGIGVAQFSEELNMQRFATSGLLGSFRQRVFREIEWFLCRVLFLLFVCVG